MQVSKWVNIGQLTAYVDPFANLHRQASRVEQGQAPEDMPLLLTDSEVQVYSS